MMIFQRSQDPDSSPSEDPDKVDMPYRVWLVAEVIFVFLSRVVSADHYELLTKMAWTIAAPGFVLSQTWNKKHDFLSRAVFGIVFLLHCILMEVIYPHLPSRSYGYVFLVAVIETMTLGLAYQVWIHIRSSSKRG